MHRCLVGFLLIALMASLGAGCSICHGPDDYTYGYYGGLYQRSDPVYGRAGSILDGSSGQMVADGETTEGEIIDEGDTYYEGEVYYEDSAQLAPQPTP